MKVTTVDHIELYVGDAAQAAGYLRQAFGLRLLASGGPETGLAGQRSLLLGHRDIRVLVTSGLVADHPAARYVEEHGDGVACVGLRTDDATGGFQEAVRAGALPVAAPQGTSVVTAIVSGPGAFTHRLVERSDEKEFLPYGMQRLSAGSGGDLLEAIDHIALCVPAGDLEPTARFYQQVFGLVEIFQERIEVGSQAMDSKVVQSASRAVTFTIVAPDPATHTGQLTDFLAANGGAGVQHLAVSTHDIVTAVRSLGDRGVRFLTTPDSYYDALEQRLGEVGLPLSALRRGSILVDRDHWGEMFQIFTESPFDRRTLFFELIERHGALTFGTNNIRALYEAKERARAAAHV
jgi:4-hydroxymandelate synthase